MMKNVLITIVLSLTSCLFAQNKLVKGEYWFDSDRANLYPVTLTSASDILINANIDVSSLYDGLHSISVRFTDEDGLWSSPVSKFFNKYTIEGNTGISEITAFESWFDNNYSERYFETISSTTDFIINEKVDVSSLYDGLHTTHIRFLDSHGKWSSVVSRFFVKKNNSVVSGSSEIDGFEYWFDNAYNQKTEVDIENITQLNLEEKIEVNDLYNGLHTVSFRAKDTQGLWSSVVSRFFVKKDSVAGMGDNKISALEYWFDDSVSQKVTVPFDQKDVNFLDQLDVSDFYEGLHTIHFRFNDESGVYSSVVSHFFVKTSVKQSSENEIVAYRYWVTDSVVHHVDLKNAASNLVLMDSLDLRRYAKGDYIVNLQFMDSYGYWSSAVSDTISKLSYPFAELQFEKPDVCLGDSVMIRAYTVDADSAVLNFGDGQSDTGSVIKHLYRSDGSYSVSVQVIDTSRDITVNYPADEAISVHALPEINLMDSMRLVDDETSVLDAGSGFVKYVWDDVEGDQTFLVSGETLGFGDHPLIIRVTDMNGCINSDTVFITVSTTEGIDGFSAVKFSIYPNPASDYIAVNWNVLNLKNTIVFVVDMTGKVVSGLKEINPGERIAVGHLPSGRYLMVLHINQRIISVPIVIRD